MKAQMKCQRCGEVLYYIVRTELPISTIGDIMRYSGGATCPECGGVAIWVDENGSPLSAVRRLREAQRHMKLTFFWVIIALIGFLIIYFLLLK